MALSKLAELKAEGRALAKECSELRTVNKQHLMHVEELRQLRQLLIERRRRREIETESRSMLALRGDQFF